MQRSYCSGCITGEESNESQWALVDFGKDISVVPMASVALKENGDGTSDSKMGVVTCTWKGKKRQFDAAILFIGM